MRTIDNSRRPTKKLKADDDSATTVVHSHDVNTSNNIGGGGFLSSWLGYFSGRGDVASSGPSRSENLSQMDRMEQIMIGVAEKLASVSSLESRCEQLEAKCSSLENKLEMTSQVMNDKLGKTLKYHEYHKMLLKNQSWKYSTPVYSEGLLVRCWI